ncbi:cytochrome d ubiquinol oxidase subunit II [Litorivicinus lipolyticus]|uniref:Cytochrome d ubiquinol oxidase subunit II n=1 Tax=Litorivicinus lipolyticus TaxID=418701 RepID=A0A5Q2QDE2_9GAMM|nr:cytochrome d ubiquinol oxidase subunit II [Litorivicinus lipolyticus]QGG79870.1 cytochrome d ubiquinol oxidase subunit II [Litorivicinus lipolyticus]
MEFFDYPTLRVIWWALLGILLIAFAVMDGFDLGAAMALPWVAQTDTQRRVVINAVGPVWEGNQVWLVLGGGAIFAAWPALYALSFSGFYLAMFLVLVGLILRPVAFKFRSKREDPSWRQRWDWTLFGSAAVPALVFGVAMGNVLIGVPYSFDLDLRVTYTGNLFGLLNPFALLAGLVSVAMLLGHGTLYLCLKTEGVIRQRARSIAAIAWLIAVALYALAGVWLWLGFDGMAVSNLVLDGPSNPLRKTVDVVPGQFFANYADWPWMMVAPLIGLAGGLVVAALAFKRAFGSAFVVSKLAIGGVIASVGLALFPIILPSSTHLSQSLSVFDASSSHTTLGIMLVCTVIFLPLIVAYTGWVYRVLWGTVREADVETHSKSMY